eukprot:2761675-Rhodomonas_salina.1
MWNFYGARGILCAYFSFMCGVTLAFVPDEAVCPTTPLCLCLSLTKLCVFAYWASFCICTGTFSLIHWLYRQLQPCGLESVAWETLNILGAYSSLSA